MKVWGRIILVVSVLIGGTTSFGFWSMHQFNTVFENMSASYLAFFTALPNRPSSFAISTSTEATNNTEDISIQLSASSTLLVNTISTTTTATSTLMTATSTTRTSETPPIISSGNDTLDPKFHLIFSPNKNSVYIGCTYEVSWQASTTIKSLGVALIDSGTRKAVGQITSGLNKENNLETNSKTLKWKVGVVWPGEYHILISSVNGIDTNEKSRKFLVKDVPSNAQATEQNNLCEF